MPDANPSHRRFSWSAAIVLIVLILALLGGFLFYRTETYPMRVADQVRGAFGEIAHLQPRILVHDRVLFEQTNSMLELAVVSRETHVEREIEHAWLGSTKRIRLRGEYKVRAGFDLTKPFRVKIDGRHVDVEVPPPRILSVDQVSVEVADYNNGLWNKFDPKQVVEDESELPLLARRKASEAGLQKEAMERFTQELRAKLGPRFEVDVRTSGSAAETIVVPQSKL